MNDKAPAFQFYPKDWLSDSNVKAMTVDAKGAYIELLCIYWLQDGLPSSTDRLARLIGVAPAKFRRLWPQIEPCFTVDGDRLRQKRMDRDRARLAQFKEERSKSGAKGAEKKWAQVSKNQRRRDGSATKEPMAKDGSPYSVLRTATPTSTPSTDNGSSAAVASGNGATWSREAADDWKQAKGGDPPGKIFGPLKRIVTAHGWDRVRPVWQYVLAQTPAQFLNVESFASAFGEWEKRARGQPPPNGAKQTVGDRAMENARKFIEGGGKT